MLHPLLGGGPQGGARDRRGHGTGGSKGFGSGFGTTAEAEAGVSGRNDRSFAGRRRAGGPAQGRRGGGPGRSRKGSGLSAADREPLGKAPDLEAIVARQRLGLPLAGRLREDDVTRAWKRAAADHHPDRGGRLDTMQAVNTARDRLLGRGVP